LFTFFISSSNRVYASPEVSYADNVILNSGNIQELSGVFAPLISMSSSPFLALTVLSGAGSLLNTGAIDASRIPNSNVLMQLPISRMDIFIVLLFITLLKALLSMISTSKVFCDATLGQIENFTGIVLTVMGTYLMTSATTVYAATAVSMGASNISFWSYLLTNVISFVLAALSYVVYIVMKTMIKAIDILAFLFSPLPGTTAFFTISKHIIVAAYSWLVLADPIIAANVGLLCLIIAFFVFRAARRLELYYRKIYLVPFLSAIFRSGHVISVLPTKIPRSVVKEFNDISICIEGFFMNKIVPFYKRELCYFVRSAGINYIFKKRFFGKMIKKELADEVYIEKCFRFARIFTDENVKLSKRNIHLVVRREHDKNINELVANANLIDNKLLLKERRHAQAEEIGKKMQKIKATAIETLSSSKKKMQKSLAGFFKEKQKTI
jgi:hypothetical protein